MLEIDNPVEHGQKRDENVPPFELVYQQYYHRVYHYLRTHLEHEEDAADLTQQVFFQVWLHLYSYEARRGSFATWILSIAHHRLVDFYRTIRHSTPWESISELGIQELTPENLLIMTENITRVKALLDGLSDFERRLLAWRFAARLSLAEIAAIIGKSEKVHFYHRTLQQYVDAAITAGWQLQRLIDIPTPEGTFQRRASTWLPEGSHFPFFMLLGFTKATALNPSDL